MKVTEVLEEIEVPETLDCSKIMKTLEVLVVMGDSLGYLRHR